MSYVDELLEFLAAREDAYTLDDISRSIGIPHYACEKIVHFLAKYNLVCLNDLKVEINPKMRNFVIATSDRNLLRISPPVATF